MSHIFGPVPSRRLGLSLGIDLVPVKTCSYDCLYCQVGRTTGKILDPEAFVPVRAITEELEEKLERVSDLLVNKDNSALLDSFLNTEKEIEIQKCYLSQER